MTTPTTPHANFALRVAPPGMAYSLGYTIPGIHRVAIQAICAKGRSVPARIPVTGDTGDGRICELPVLLTGLASYAQMPADQREFGFVVVERIVIPTSRFMT